MSTPLDQFAPPDSPAFKPQAPATHRWQIPLMVLSAVLLVLAVLRLRPPVLPPTFEEQLGQLRALMKGGLYGVVVQDAGKLLESVDEPGDRAAALHQLIAEAVYLAEAPRPTHDANNALGILNSLALAEQNGWGMRGRDWRISGAAFEWLGRSTRALEDYGRALDAGVEDPLSLKLHIVALEQERGELGSEQMLALYDDLIDSCGGDAAVLVRAVRSKVELLAELGRFDDAEQAIAQAEPLLEQYGERRDLDYCSAWLLYGQGRIDDAERALRAVRAHLERADDVYARCGWLLGRINLENDRPAEALSFFQDILGTFPSGAYRAACLLGAAEALARLEEYGASAESYRILVTEKSFGDADALVGRERVRTSLALLAEELDRRGAPGDALVFAELAEQLTRDGPPEVRAGDLERLAWAHAAMAEWLLQQVSAHTVDATPHPPQRRDNDSAPAPEQSAGDPSPEQRMRHHYAAAAASFETLAGVLGRDEDRSTEALWHAANFFDRAGETRDTIRVLRDFVRSRPSSPRMPFALLRLGQSYQSLREYEPAIEAYSRNLEEFPRTPPAIGSVVPLAECYLELGDDHFDDAERTLRSLVDQNEEGSATVTPAAWEYRQALFLLGEMYVRREAHERAIRALEEALARYPHSDESDVARFLLADSYRRSCDALREVLKDAAAAAYRQRLEVEIARRLTRAHDLFALVAQTAPQDAAEAASLRAEYARLALFYQADCLFDLGRFEQALPLYEEAAWRYHDRPAALSAYVQILNCHQRLGRQDEARTALQRARQIVGRIPEDRFTLLSAGISRNEWSAYLNRVADSPLFE